MILKAPVWPRCGEAVGLFRLALESSAQEAAVIAERRFYRVGRCGYSGGGNINKTEQKPSKSTKVGYQCCYHENSGATAAGTCLCKNNIMIHETGKFPPSPWLQYASQLRRESHSRDHVFEGTITNLPTDCSLAQSAVACSPTVAITGSLSALLVA
jgi:hypothetical protein